MTTWDRFVKRAFDIVVAGGVLLVLWPLIAVCIVVARIDTGDSGLFRQRRLGRRCREFTIYKLRTMRAGSGSMVTVANDARITPVGRHLRRWKLDELPQLWNVLKGDMSLVGPRPDVAGYLDRLQGEDRIVAELRPGITGPATLKYRDEEQLLLSADDPQAFNDEVIWPDKVRINREYMNSYSLFRDLKLLKGTIFRE